MEEIMTTNERDLEISLVISNVPAIMTNSELQSIVAGALAIALGKYGLSMGGTVEIKNASTEACQNSGPMPENSEKE